MQLATDPPNSTLSVNCPILDRPTRSKASPYSTERWKLAECLETGLVYLLDPPAYDAVADQFAWEKSFVAEQEKRRSDEPIVSRVSTFFNHLRTRLFRSRDKMLSLAWPHIANKSTVQVLDVGSGQGHRMLEFCQKLSRRQIDVVPLGIEISQPLAEQSNAVLEKLGGRVINDTALDGLAMLQPSSIDVIFMNCYLEHESQPLDVLRQARLALKPSGIIVIKVPNFACVNRRVRGSRWCGFRFPDHVNYFSPDTLERVAKEAELAMQPQRLLDRFPTSDNMYALMRKA